MEFMRIGKARNLLMQSEKAKKALIDTLRKEEITGDMKNKLLKIKEIVSFCEREETDISLVNVVISSLLSDENPQTDDFIKVIEILSECQRDLKNFLQENINPSIRNSKEFTENYSAIVKYIKEKEENIK